MRQAYPGDLTDVQWELLAPLFPEASTGAPRKVNIRDVIDAIDFINRTGVQWRYLPHDFPHWHLVYSYFRKWSKDGTLDEVQRVLREAVREQAGREPTPSLASIDPPMKDAEKVQVKIKLTTLVMMAAEMSVKSVEAYSVDGKAISAKTLANLLAKEPTVLVALDGRKVDPFLLHIYKEGTIVLVPPANALNQGRGGFSPHPQPGGVIEAPVRPRDVPDRQDPRRDPERKDD